MSELSEMSEMSEMRERSERIERIERIEWSERIEWNEWIFAKWVNKRATLRDELENKNFEKKWVGWQHFLTTARQYCIQHLLSRCQLQISPAHRPSLFAKPHSKERQLFIHKVFISSRRTVFFKTSLASEAAERFKRGKGAHPPLPLRCSLAPANFFQSFTVTTSIFHNAPFSCSGGPASWCFLGCC